MTILAWGKSRVHSWAKARMVVHDRRSWHRMLNMWGARSNRYSEWRMWAVNVFDLNRLKLGARGRYPYGPLSVQTRNNPTERMTVGQCVSVAYDVVFELGGSPRANPVNVLPGNVLPLR